MSSPPAVFSPASATLPASRTAPVSGSVEPEGVGRGASCLDGAAAGSGRRAAASAFRPVAAGVARDAAAFGREAAAFGRAVVRLARAGFALAAPAFERADLALVFARAALARVDGEALGAALFVAVAEPSLAALARPVAPAPRRLSLRSPGRDRGRLPSTPGSSLLPAATREK